VVGNTLQTRKHVIYFITQHSKEVELRLTKDQIDKGEEIEPYIVDWLVKKHEEWILSNSESTQSII
jgi:hypothetical protein